MLPTGAPSGTTSSSSPSGGAVSLPVGFAPSLRPALYAVAFDATSGSARASAFTMSSICARAEVLRGAGAPLAAGAAEDDDDGRGKGGNGSPSSPAPPRRESSESSMKPLRRRSGGL